MTETKAIATAMEEWAAESSAVNAYPNEPPNYHAAMPIVAARIISDTEQDLSTDFADENFEQYNLQAITIELGILADPEPEWTADQALYDIVDDLKAALKSDPTLGSRVDRASKEYRVSYDGEVQTADGTRANMATFTMVVANRVGVS